MQKNYSRKGEKNHVALLNAVKEITVFQDSAPVPEIGG